MNAPSVASRPPLTPQHVAVTCKYCLFRHQLARTFTKAGVVWVICHGCEVPLRAEIAAKWFAGTRR